MIPQGNLFGWNDEAPEDVESKVCIKCGVDKALSCYSIANNNYLRTSCKTCITSESKVREDLRAKVALPLADHCCPLCLKTAEDVSGHGGLKAGPWVLDHCHTSGKFRGWLCHNCNRALGLFKDKVDSLERAIDYLKS